MNRCCRCNVEVEGGYVCPKCQKVFLMLRIATKPLLKATRNEPTRQRKERDSTRLRAGRIG